MSFIYGSPVDKSDVNNNCWTLLEKIQAPKNSTSLNRLPKVCFFFNSLSASPSPLGTTWLKHAVIDPRAMVIHLQNACALAAVKAKELPSRQQDHFGPGETDVHWPTLDILQVNILLDPFSSLAHIPNIPHGKRLKYQSYPSKVLPVQLLGLDG